MNSVIKIIVKSTGEVKTAVYAANTKGNMRYHVDGKSLTDKQFDKLYTIIHEGDKNNNPGQPDSGS